MARRTVPCASLRGAFHKRRRPWPGRCPVRVTGNPVRRRHRAAAPDAAVAAFADSWLAVPVRDRLNVSVPRAIYKAARPLAAGGSFINRVRPT